LLQSYQRAHLWRKAMLVSFVVIFIAILFWTIPWLPYGFSEEDYNGKVVQLMVLVVTACLTAFGAVYHRDAGHRLEQTMLTWTTVHEGLGDLRQREYLYERIVIECERARHNRREFTVVALRLGEAEDGDSNDALATAQAMTMLAPILEESTCIALMGPREIGIMAPHVQMAQAPAYAARAREQVEAGSIDLRTPVRVGWAVYPVEAQEAGGLVGLARARLLGKKRAGPDSASETPDSDPDLAAIA
jgi:GGDEF domain-containing protein